MGSLRTIRKIFAATASGAVRLGDDRLRFRRRGKFGERKPERAFHSVGCMAERSDKSHRVPQSSTAPVTVPVIGEFASC